MITIQKIGKLLMVFLIVAGMASCNDDDDKAPFAVIGETVTLKKMVDDTARYAVAYYAYGNYAMTSASVKFPSGDSIALSAMEGYKQTFYKDPASADYSKDTPEEGTFTFSVVNEGIKHTATDKLDVKDFDVPTITEVTANTGNTSITVEWDKVTNADGYVIRLMNDEDEVVFISTFIPNTSDNFVISANTGLKETLESGKTYTVDLQALLYEDSATASDRGWNVEMISIASEDVVYDNN